jgi:hypothetical protein
MQPTHSGQLDPRSTKQIEKDVARLEIEHWQACKDQDREGMHDLWNELARDKGILSGRARAVRYYESIKDGRQEQAMQERLNVQADSGYVTNDLIVQLGQLRAEREKLAAAVRHFETGRK